MAKRRRSPPAPRVTASCPALPEHLVTELADLLADALIEDLRQFPVVADDSRGPKPDTSSSWASPGRAWGPPSHAEPERAGKKDTAVTRVIPTLSP